MALTGKQRLEVLSTALHGDLGAHYNQSTVAMIDRHEDESLADYLKKLLEYGIDIFKPLPKYLTLPIACHTEGCAIGQALFLPVLQAEGLRLMRQNDYADTPLIDVLFDNDETDLGSYYTISINGVPIPYWINSIAEFFDIPVEASATFFGNAVDCTPDEKARQMDYYLDTGTVRDIYSFQSNGSLANYVRTPQAPDGQ